MPRVLELRFAVFCEEQGVPEELERDDSDAGAVHLVVADGGEVIGTCRLLGAGATVVRLGRMAVARERRGEGLGGLLLEQAHQVAREDGAHEVELHAQVAVAGFYARAGYAAEGGHFMEAGIAHVIMRRPLEPVRR